MRRVVVLWKSGHTSRSRFSFSAEQALGRRGTIGMLRVEDGVVLDPDEERRSAFANSIVDSARALARSCDLVIVEIDQAHRTPTWRNRSGLALLRLVKAGAASVLCVDSSDDRSIGNGVDRMEKLLTAAPDLDHSRTFVLLDWATADRSPENGDAIGMFTELGMTNVHLVGKMIRNPNLRRSALDQVETGVAIQTAVFEILTAMRLPALTVTEEGFRDLFGPTAPLPDLD